MSKKCQKVSKKGQKSVKNSKKGQKSQKSVKNSKKGGKGYFPLFLESDGFLEIPEIGGILCELGEEAEEAVGEHEVALKKRVGAAGLKVIGF